MYAHCLFCAADLGRNEVVEHFPVGRRLAFDAARGRLWVVCRRCLRWNLTPLEERWEAIEEAERLFRDTPLRSSTGNIGLAKVREGLELVRIGRPERPEFAAWRYGETFLRRRTRLIAVGVGATAVVGVSVATGAFALLKTVVPGAGFLYQVPNLINMYRMTHKPVARVPSEGGTSHVLRGKHVKEARLLGGSGETGWELQVDHDAGTSRLAGERAIDVAARLLARLNQSGGSRRQVGDAVRLIETRSTPHGLLRGVAGTLQRMPPVDRLALEMAVHEESERRALEGELGALEERWKEAEQIAAIADDLLLPERVARTLRRLKGGAE